MGGGVGARNGAVCTWAVRCWHRIGSAFSMVRAGSGVLGQPLGQGLVLGDRV